jgi:hypothetical protein
MAIRIIVADHYESLYDRQARNAVEDEVSGLLAENPDAKIRGMTVNISRQGTRVFSVLVELPDVGKVELA